MSKKAPFIQPTLFTVVYQEWEESERGWGRRNDGYTLHLTKADCLEYIKAEDEREKERNPSGEVPDCYTFASGTPQPIDVEIDVLNKLTELRKQGVLGHWVMKLPKPRIQEEAERLAEQKKQLEAEAAKQRLENLRKSALEKLTAEEREVLGLKDESKPAPNYDPNRGWRYI